MGLFVSITVCIKLKRMHHKGMTPSIIRDIIVIACKFIQMEILWNGIAFNKNIKSLLLLMTST